MVVKKCSKCGTLKNLNDFPVNRTKRSGVQGACKSCDSEYHKEYYRRHREAIRARRKNNYEANKETRCQYSRAYYHANKGRDAERVRKYYEANRERRLKYYAKWQKENAANVKAKHRERYESMIDRILNQNREWRKKNHDKVKDYNRERKALKRGVTSERFNSIEIFERDGWICRLCGEVVNRELKHPHPLSASLDHITPLAKNGTHKRANVQLSHLVCNIRAGIKGARKVWEEIPPQPIS